MRPLCRNTEASRCSFVMRSRVPLLALLCISCAQVSSTSAVTLCFKNSGYSITTFDITTAVQELANHIPPSSPTSYLIPPKSTHSLIYGSAQFCLQNQDSQNSEDAAIGDIAIGGNEVINTCCVGLTTCEGGIYAFDEAGESQLLLDVKPASGKCECCD